MFNQFTCTDMSKNRFVFEDEDHFRSIKKANREHYKKHSRDEELGEVRRHSKKKSKHIPRNQEHAYSGW